MKKKAIIDENVYDVEQAEVKPVKVLDPGEGKPIILRSFKFAFTPEQLKHGTITEDGLRKSVNFKTDSHGTQDDKLKIIEHLLWVDELRLIEVPRVSLTPDKKGFYVFATCQARKGSRILQEPKLIQDAITSEPTK